MTPQFHVGLGVMFGLGVGLGIGLRQVQVVANIKSPGAVATGVQQLARRGHPGNVIKSALRPERSLRLKIVLQQLMAFLLRLFGILFAVLREITEGTISTQGEMLLRWDGDRIKRENHTRYSERDTTKSVKGCYATTPLV